MMINIEKTAENLKCLNCEFIARNGLSKILSQNLFFSLAKNEYQCQNCLQEPENRINGRVAPALEKYGEHGQPKIPYCKFASGAIFVGSVSGISDK